MASVTFSAECVLPTRSLKARSVARSTNKRMNPCSWRAMADAASGITFLGLLGWEAWRIGGLLADLTLQMLAAGAGHLF